MTRTKKHFGKKTKTKFKIAAKLLQTNSVFYLILVEFNISVSIQNISKPINERKHRDMFLCCTKVLLSCNHNIKDA